MFEQIVKITRRVREKRVALTAILMAGLLACLNLDLLARAHAQDLTVSADFADKPSVAPNEPIALRLSRPLQAAEGRLAVLIGQMDVTALSVVNETGLTYTPILPLPAGASEVTVYLVASNNIWKELARFPLHVAVSQDAQQAPPQPVDAGPQPGATNGKKAGFDKLDFTPALTLGIKSQPGESHFPDANRPPRSTFTDFTLQGSLRMEMARGGFNSQSQFDIVGSSFQQEALRFGEKGNAAPHIDLSSYLMQFQAGKAKIQVGHVAFGSNRHLINSFSSRGVTITVPLSTRSDFSVAAMNGTSIVGWDNFIGLNRRKHQIISGTLGFEFLKARPGGLRLETAILHGSLLPLNNFNQGVVNDAEQSRGLSFRLLASDKAQRFRLDSGFARSRFNNPNDPLLAQSNSLVSVREESRNAGYIEAGYNVLNNLAISTTKKASLAFNYRLERVDPLFRSVAAFTQADRFQHQYELVGSIAEVTATYSHNRFHDNLDDIPSILKSLTRRNALMLGAPLVSLVGDPAKPSPWLPRLSYAYDRVHQFGRAFPANSGFDSVSQVPDQISDNHNFMSDWQAEKWRVGYRFNRSFQDNRQPGRERADLRNLINGFTFGVTPVPAFDLSVDVSAESARNCEMARTDRTLRAGSTINWRMAARAALAATVSTTFAGDVANTSDSRNAELDLQWSYRFGLERSRYRKVSGQFFIRYANRYARSLDTLFGLDNRTRLQTLNTGVSFTFF